MALLETFEAIVFDWDGTAVQDQQADASGVRERIEAFSAAGVHVFVVSGAARSQGRGQLHLCCDRGSEVFAVTSDGPQFVLRRTASPEEDVALDRVAERTVERLRSAPILAMVASLNAMVRRGPPPLC